MAYKQRSPQVVAEGGTGVGSLTAYAPICGGTTSTGAIQSIASVGTSGQVLTSNGAALPTFQAAGGVTGPGSSTDNALARWSGTGGDTLQDSTVIVTDAGEMTNASQPAFMAYLASTVDNLTGNGTVVIMGNSDISMGYTEVYDQNADFVPSASGGAVFTAPVTGKYLLTGSCGLKALGAGHTTGYSLFITSNRGYYGRIHNPGVQRNAADAFTFCNTIWADMDTSDTFQLSAAVDNSTKTVGFTNPQGGDIALTKNFICGNLIC